MRIKSLDSIRGIAALVVLLGHCYLTYPETLRANGHPLSASSWAEPWVWMRYTPLRLLVDGQAAVLAFFVLSGFVLSLPYLHDTQPAYPRYVAKRYCRIYLPFAIAILCSAVLYHLVQPAPIPSLSIWFNDDSWSRPVNFRAILVHLAMTGLPQDRFLDNPMWSLVHELRISIIFPALLLIVASGPRRALVLAAVIYAVSVLALLRLGEASAIGTLLATAKFILFFVVGIALAMHVDTWLPVVARLPPRAKLVLWLVSAAAFLWPATLTPWFEFVWGVGATILIALSLASAMASRILLFRPLVWLGRVSYSLYLVHLLVLLTAVHLLYGLLPLWLIIAGVVPASLVCAEIMYRAVEVPSIRMGQWFAARPRGAIADSGVGLTG